MLSEERINELANTLRVKDGDIHGVTAFARAIEAECEKVPEGYALVSIAQLKTWGCYEALDAMCQYPLAAAPKPAQASPLDLMECLQDRPVEPSKAVQGKCVVQAEKQEPVKDKPVAYVNHTLRKSIDWCADYTELKTGTKLYTRPQPDLTAEVEFMQGKYEEMLEEWLPQKQRIAELEAAAREARDALQYHTSQTRPIFNTTDAIIKLDAVLGNA